MEQFEKRCKKCGSVKPIDQFYFAVRYKDNRYPYCKYCSNKQSRDWQHDNKKRVNETKRIYYANNEQYRLAHRYRNTIKNIINNKGLNTQFLIDCGCGGSRDVFMDHLISTIPEGYTIDDYGTHVYDGKLSVDHIIPCVAFDLTDPAQVKLCFNINNLRLVPKKLNCQKGKSVKKSDTLEQGKD